MTAASAAVAAAYKSDWVRIVSGLIRLTRDWSLAEDAAAEAFGKALEHWGSAGVPANPAGWLSTTARHLAIDHLRRRVNERSKLAEIALIAESTPADQDDPLRLIFTCCHPALDLASQVALTLRTVCGLSVADIARAFLVPTTTMEKRLVRARQKIAHAGIPYRVPAPEALGDRLNGVLTVVYLTFNQGYEAGSDRHIADTAVALAGQLAEMMPTQSEVRGLFALLLIQHSRRDARFDAGGRLLTIEEQDRTRWRTADIVAAGRHLRAAVERGPYVLQALIANCHAAAPHADDTDWARIVLLYNELAELRPSPVVELNRAVAIGMCDGPTAGLAALKTMEPSLPGSRYLVAARADMLERAGRRKEALAHYERLHEMTENPAERVQIHHRITYLRADVALPD